MNDYDPNKQQRYNRPETWPPPAGRVVDRLGYAPATAAQVSAAERMSFVRKVYALFFAATLFAVGGAGLGLSFTPLLRFAFEHPFVMVVLMLGGVMGAQAVRHVRGLNLLALFVFTTLTGVMISPLLYVLSQVNPGSILQAGVLTVGIFGSLTAYVFISKKDFSFMRGMLMVGLVVVVLAGLLSFFVASNALGFAVSAAALILFSGFVLYDTSNIIRRYPVNEYVAGALSLYLDAFNIFLSLLNILNSGRR